MLSESACSAPLFYQSACRTAGTGAGSAALLFERLRPIKAVLQHLNQINNVGRSPRGRRFRGDFFVLRPKIRSVEELWIHLFQVHEVGDINGMRGLDSHLLEVLILHDDITTTLVF